MTSSTLVPFAAGTIRNQGQATVLRDLRMQLNDLQRQLASGKKAETYGGLGEMRVSSLTFRNQTGIAENFKSVTELTDIRLQVMDRRTNELRQITETARSVMLRTRGTGGFPEITSAKQQVQASFEQMITSLNAQHEGLYLFSGRSRDVRPVVDANTLMNGDGTNAGLKTVISERIQADTGVTGLGRLTNTVAGSTVSVAEDAVGNPFGIKLIPGTVGGSMSNVTVTGPAGAPLQVDFNFTGIPVAGDRVTFDVRLPDGKVKTLGFAVDQASTSDDTVFAAGATPAATALNLQAAITGRLSSLVAGEMRSASGVIATQQFFAGSPNNAPLRVAGPPFNTSTATTTARPTVIWYRGDDTATNMRNTQVAEVNDGTTVGLGAAANEVAFRDSLVAMGLFLAEDYSAPTATTQDRFDAATARSIEIFNSTGGPNAILEINGDFGRATAQARDAKTRHNESMQFLKGLLGEIENASNEEVIMNMTSLQTRLEASYQATARISQLSLVNFLR